MAYALGEKVIWVDDYENNYCGWDRGILLITAEDV